MDFLDSATAHVLGTRVYLDRLDPDSPAGRRMGRSPRLYGPREREAWLEERRRLVESDDWAAAHPDAVAEVRRHLAQLPELPGVLERLQEGLVLRDAELFQIKRLCYFGWLCLEATEALVQAWGEPDWRTYLQEVMAEIHPEVRPTPRFALASELDGSLAEARAHLARAQRAFRELRQGLEAEVLGRHGGSFDLYGNYRPAQASVRLEDPALVWAEGRWRLGSAALLAAECEQQEMETLVSSLEEGVRRCLSMELRTHRARLERVAPLLTALDVSLARVRLRQRLGGCWPEWVEGVGEGWALVLEDGLEPQTRARLEGGGAVGQPVSFALGERAVVVAGPNMGGKTVLLKLAGLSMWCALHALPVPAARCRFAPVGGIVYVGSEEPSAQTTDEGLSSFGREVARLVSHWERAAGQAPRLWLLDEPGRGTHPEEGAALSSEVVEALQAKGERVMVATHFPQMLGLAQIDRLRIRGLPEDVELEPLLRAVSGDGASLQAQLAALMDYRPVPMEATDIPRDARRIARALGLAVRAEARLPGASGPSPNGR